MMDPELVDVDPDKCATPSPSPQAANKSTKPIKQLRTLMSPSSQTTEESRPSSPEIKKTRSIRRRRQHVEITLEEDGKRPTLEEFKEWRVPLRYEMSVETKTKAFELLSPARFDRYDSWRLTGLVAKSQGLPFELWDRLS